MPKNHPPLATIAGITTIVTAISLGAVAYGFYPSAFSPAGNWLSDLGNTVLSPHGAIFFRLDMWVVGLALIAFFFGLRAWSRGRGLWLRLLVVAAQVSGFVAAVALVMTGVFPENRLAAHSLWATVLFLALAIAVWFIGWAILAHPHLSSLLAGFAFAVCAVDVIAVTARRHWLEWLAVVLLLTLVGVLAHGTSSLASRGVRPAR